MTDAVSSVLVVAGIIAVVQAVRIARRPRPLMPRAGHARATDAPTRRPFGVTAIAVLYFFASFWCVLMVFLSITAPTVLRALLHVMESAPPHSGAVIDGLVLVARLPLAYLFGLTFITLVLGGRSFGMAGLLAALGYGMWRPQNWARLITVALFALPLIRLLLDMRHVESSTRAFVLGTSIAVCLAVVSYLFTPRVREAFRSTV